MSNGKEHVLNIDQFQQTVSNRLVLHCVFHATNFRMLIIFPSEIQSPLRVSFGQW